MVSSIPSIKEVLIVDLTVAQPGIIKFVNYILDLSDEANSYVEELKETHEAIMYSFIYCNYVDVMKEMVYIIHVILYLPMKEYNIIYIV